MPKCKGHAVCAGSVIACISPSKFFPPYLLKPSRGCYSACGRLWVPPEWDKHLNYRFCTGRKSITFSQGQPYCFSRSAWHFDTMAALYSSRHRTVFNKKPCDTVPNEASMPQSLLFVKYFLPLFACLLYWRWTKTTLQINWACSHSSELHLKAEVVDIYYVLPVNESVGNLLLL